MELDQAFMATPEGALPPCFAGYPRPPGSAVVHAYRVQNEVIPLEHDADVAPPAACGLQLARLADFRNCRRSADIGTGTGLLAILAARKGVAEVEATDLSRPAVVLATRNAERSRAAAVSVAQRDLFGGLSGTFDVITANLPQEIIPPASRPALSRPAFLARHGGGPGGNAILLDFLDKAPAFMHAKSRLYIVINTLTDYRCTLRRLQHGFRARLLWEGFTPVTASVSENLAFFGPLRDAGVVAVVEDGLGGWKARHFIFELRLDGH